MSQQSTATPCSRWNRPLKALCAIVALWGLGYSAWRIATEGVGVLGVNNSVPWGWDIVNFVFWIVGSFDFTLREIWTNGG